MSESQKLKDRFNKLQLEINNPVSAEPYKATNEPGLSIKELPISLQPELHQTLREVKDTKLNWKKALRAQAERILVNSQSEITPLLLERTIQQLAKKRITVSVCMAQPEDKEVLNKLINFFKSRSNLFIDLFEAANVCLVRVHKGRPVVEVNAFESGTIEFVGQRLELEAAKSGSSLSSFQIENRDGWLSITFNITEKPIRSFEEISQ